MIEILQEDECNDTYGRKRMYEALLLKKPEGVDIPSERTVYRVMQEIGISHRPKRTPNGITKADQEARKTDDLFKRDFQSDQPLKNYEGKVSTDIDNTSFAITAFLCPKTLEPGQTGDCYTVIIRGERKYLFFKRNLRMYDHRIGRWWVEVES